MFEQVERIEKEFEVALLQNDAHAIARFLAADWIIISSEGKVIQRDRFLEVIRTGLLIHTRMKTSDSRIRVYNDTAVVTGLTISAGSFGGQEFSNRERGTSVYVQQNGTPVCVLTHLTSVYES